MYEYVSCDLCGADSSSLLYTVDSFKIVKCRECSLIYVNPRLSKANRTDIHSSESYYQRYRDGIASSCGHGYMQARKVGKLNSLSVGARLLDVGCGTGEFLRAAIEAGWEGMGIDVSEAASEFARSNYGIEVITGDLREIGLPPSSFDVVTLWEVLEHMSSPTRCLAEINRILVADGVLAISVPNAESFQARMQREEFVQWKPSYHIYHFSPETLRKLLEKTGFQVIQIETPFPIVTSRSLKTKGIVVGSRAKKVVWKYLRHPLRIVRRISGRFIRGPEMFCYAKKRIQIEAN